MAHAAHSTVSGVRGGQSPYRGRVPLDHDLARAAYARAGTYRGAARLLSDELGQPVSHTSVRHVVTGAARPTVRASRPATLPPATGAYRATASQLVALSTVAAGALARGDRRGAALALDRVAASAAQVRATLLA